MASSPPVEKIDVGRVLGRGFEALKANFLPFFACALVLGGIPSFFLQYWMFAQLGAGPEAAAFAVAAGSLGGSLLLLVAGSLLQGVLMRSTVLFLSGRPADIGASLALGLRLLLPILGISILVGLATGVGFLLLVVPGVMIYCAFIVAVPALVEERRGVFGSMQRSRDLTRGSRKRVFLLLLVIWVFSYIITSTSNLISGVSMINPFTGELPDPLLAGISAGLANALSSVILAVLLGALYVELRTVKEGATTDDLAAIFE